MPNTLSILEEIGRGGYEASLITTFNAYLPFYEHVVLPRLRSRGMQHNVLLMDARQCAAAVHQHVPVAAGRLYSLLPMRTHAGVFHPKVILLVGKNKGLLMVGSHNVTLSGWGTNRELSNALRLQSLTDKAAIAVFRQAWGQIQGWIDATQEHLPEALRDAAAKVGDFAPWITQDSDPADGTVVLSAQADQTSLWAQLLERIERPVRRVLLTGAFFDKQLEFIQRIQDDLAPDEIVVGIDPRTAYLPGGIRPIPGVRWVEARGLGTEAQGYLHAKALFIETAAETYLVSGSANPSKPAWLHDGLKGNIEMMLVRQGSDAGQAAADLGLTDLADQDPLGASIYQTIAQNRPTLADRELPPETGTLGTAVIDSSHISWDDPKTLCDAIELLDSQQCVLERVTIEDIKKPVVRLEVSEQLKQDVCLLRGLHKGQTVLTLLVHHKQYIDEQSRTPLQRRFRQSLTTLESDSPDLATFLQCAEKMIFDEKVPTRSSRTVSGQEAIAKETEGAGHSLVAAPQERGAFRQKRRMLPSGDNLTYMLDWLLYKLRMQDTATNDGTDALGRNEEENVGAEDEDIPSPEQTSALSAESADKILKLCQSKVRRLVDRTLKQLEAYLADDLKLDALVVRLTAVLVLLRELRRCDRREWVIRGWEKTKNPFKLRATFKRTTVLVEEEKRLLDAVVRTLAKDDISWMDLHNHHPHVEASDELSRLKGLLLWLAWDCGVQFEPTAAPYEQWEETQARAHNNAVSLMLAQLVERDDIVGQEAQKSIDDFARDDDTWLERMLRLNHTLLHVRDDVHWQPGDTARPGDLARPTAKKAWGYYLVQAKSETAVKVYSLSRDDGQISYKDDYIRILPRDRFESELP